MGNKYKDNNIITPQVNLIKELVRYDQTSANLNWTMKYVGVTRVDNTQNKYSSAKLIFTATSSGSFKAAANVSGTTAAEINLVVSKVDATVTIGGTFERVWTQGMTYGTETSVPPGKIGEIYAYIPGTASKGYAIYKVTDDYGYSFYEQKACGANVPAENSWNMVVKIY